MLVTVVVEKGDRHPGALMVRKVSFARWEPVPFFNVRIWDAQRLILPRRIRSMIW